MEAQYEGKGVTTIYPYTNATYRQNKLKEKQLRTNIVHEQIKFDFFLARR